jgi:adenylate cyclase class 2
MKEIELKILEINPKEIEKKIISLGGKKVGSYILKVRLYDFPDGRLKSNFSILRIRTYENEKNKIEKTEFTFKQATDDLRNKSEFKICEELQTEVSDAGELQKIIEALGLVFTKDLEKKRTSFILDKTKIEIDIYPGVPPYIEIEGDEKTIPLVVKKLGYTMKDTTNIGGIQVLKKYGKNTEFLKF